MEQNRIVEIPLLCKQEDMEIGHLRVKAGRVRLNTDTVWRSFVPVTPAYKLVKRQRDGEYLRCPHCEGSVQIQGDLRYHVPVEGEEKPTRKVGVDEGTRIEIILGQTITAE